MNIGNAVRSQEFDAVHIEVASTWPAGVDTLVSTAAKPHTASASPIHTPEPSTANSSSIRTRESWSSFTCSTLFPERDGVLGGSEGRPSAAQHDDQFVQQRDRKHQRAERHRRLRIDLSLIHISEP